MGGSWPSGAPNFERGLPIHPYHDPLQLGFYCLYFPAKLLARYRVAKVAILLLIAVGAAAAVTKLEVGAQHAGFDRDLPFWRTRAIFVAHKRDRSTGRFADQRGEPSQNRN